MKDIVKMLVQVDQLPAQIALECLHDANEETRAVVRKYLDQDKRM
jgi:hypothetical protein